MNETQRNIKRYKAALPGLRERITAAALLLVVSLSMVVSTSLAWLTISRAPAVMGMSTTVAANGNLEIALVQPSGERPAESAVGDSLAAAGQDIVGANITWGNLVNLSDKSYGLENIVLRPSLLSNAMNLLDQPLKGADYGEDGRMELFYNEAFKFTNWNQKESFFEYASTPKYGVRAISTVKVTSIQPGAKLFDDLMTEANGLRDANNNEYSKMIGNDDYIKTLAGLIGDYMTDNLNNKEGTNQINIAKYMPKLYALMCEFDVIIDDFRHVVVALANTKVYQHCLLENQDRPAEDVWQMYLANRYDWNKLSTATDAQLKETGVIKSKRSDFSILDEYINLRNSFKNVLYGDGELDTEKLDPITYPDNFDCIQDYYIYVNNKNSNKLYMFQLDTYIQKLVDIGSCKIIHESLPNGYSTVNTLGVKQATKLLGEKVDAQITKGIIKDFEQISGCKMNAENVEVKATYLITVSITAKTITTAAKNPSTYLSTATAITDKQNAEYAGSKVYVAEDTYGMAMDFWVRTNAVNSYLILEGNVLTEQEEVRATGTDQTGKTVELWSVDVTSTFTDEEGNQQELTENVAIYEDSDGIWRRAESHAPIYQTESNVKVETSGTPVAAGKKGQNKAGEEVDLYTVKIIATKADGTTVTVKESAEVYQVGEVWYRYDNYAQLNKNYSTWQSLDESGNYIVPEGMTISDRKQRFDTISTVIGYEGENRIWQDNELLDVTSTTQGSGSCYVFYADDPSQQENSLRLLSNLRVAFIDSTEGNTTYGKVVGVAELDIEHRFEESGRVTLPLVLTDDGSDYLTQYGAGNLAIMPLEKNEPTRITAVVYLDGRSLSNSEVLAANSIEGQLNIQFGSTSDLNAKEDEKLELAERSVSVVASKTSGSFGGNGTVLEYDFDDTDPLTVYVRMKVDGEQPNNAEGFFMRKVNDVQGSREESFELTRGSDDYWYGEYTFTAPGDYVLQTVQLDGVDYDLHTSSVGEGEKCPRVKINGFTVGSVTMAYDGNVVEGMHTIMTGANAVNADLTVQLASSKKLPSTVKLQLQEDDGTLITANMTTDGSGKWTGTANFTTSGNYTLKYIIMDGEYTELDAAMQHTMRIYMGIKVRVDDGGESYRNQTWEGNEVEIPVYVEILDNTDEPIPYLSGVKLTYLRNNSVVGKMDADLGWDINEKCYVGSLHVGGPGRYTFGNVKVGETNTLTNTLGTTPVYTYISPDPVSYLDAKPMEGLTYQLSTTDSTIYTGVRVANAEAATVIATFEDKDVVETVDGKQVYRTVTVEANASGEPEMVDGQRVSTFMFPIPKNSDGYQSGDWEITGISMYNVYGEGGRFYASESDTFDVIPPEEHDLAVKVVNAVVEVIGVDESYGNTVEESGKTNYYFMDSKTTENPISVKITDQNGDALDSDYITISDVKLTYQHKPNSAGTCGGYSSAALENISIERSVAQPGSDKVTYSLPTFNMEYAGEYLADQMMVTISEKSFENENVEMRVDDEHIYTSLEMADQHKGTPTRDFPVYTLKTVIPSVVITDITLDGGGAYAIDKTTTGYICDSYNTTTEGSGCDTKLRYDFTINSSHLMAASNTQYISRIVDSNGNTATTGCTAYLYFKCSHASTKTTWSDYNLVTWKPHDYLFNNGEGVPAATLTLSGFGGADSAYLQFAEKNGGNVNMITQYSGSGSSYKGDYKTYGTDKYEWEDDGICKRFIGYMVNGGGEHDSDTKTVAGEIFANKLVFVYDGKEYNFTIPTITIHNDY